MSEYVKDMLPREKITSQEVDDIFGIDSLTTITDVECDTDFAYQLANETEEMKL